MVMIQNNLKLNGEKKREGGPELVLWFVVFIYYNESQVLSSYHIFVIWCFICVK